MHSDWYQTMSNNWQWFFSLVAIPGLFVAAHTRLFEERCRDCWRKGHVPVSGTAHKVCKRHAAAGGHSHP
jgi:hypothetical protein